MLAKREFNFVQCTINPTIFWEYEAVRYGGFEPKIGRIIYVREAGDFGSETMPEEIVAMGYEAIRWILKMMLPENYAYNLWHVSDVDKV